MRHLDLFTGIGCFSLAADWAWPETHDIVSFCEIDKDYYKHLNHYWNGVPIEQDIRKFKAAKYLGTIDLLTAGIPCQPASIAGKRLGTRDDRWLWPETLRIVEECRPRWAIFENPADIITLDNGMAIEGVLAHLEGIGYEVKQIVIPACGVGANHIRYRLWIIAHTDEIGRTPRNRKRRISQIKIRNNAPKKQRRYNKQFMLGGKSPRNGTGRSNGIAMHAGSKQCKRRIKKQTSQQQNFQAQFARAVAGWRAGWTIPRRGVARIYDGFADRFHEVNLMTKKRDKRVEAIGNALTPAIPFVIFNFIKQIEEQS